jgi:chromosomal replication initiator protein
MLIEQAWEAFPKGLPSTGKPKLPHIMSAVALHTGISADDIKSARKTKHIIFARHIYCYLARTMTPLSYPQIAQAISRDHTTIIHSVSRVEDELRKGTDCYVQAVAYCRSTALYMAGGHD